MPTVPDRNGAGIRQEGTDLTVTRSWFHDNENGILTGADPESDIVIERSRFFRNGYGDGYSHNLYVGAVRSLTVTGSWLSRADTGHELKSRAARNTIVANRISDGDATASYSIDLPNGGLSLVAGNVVVQGPRSENPALVSYGAEGLTNPSRTLWVVNNTFVNQRTSGTYVALADGSRAHLRNNLLVGPGELASGAGRDARANRRVGLGGFVDPAREDFRLTASSRAVDRGVRVPRRWRPRLEYVAPAGLVRRRTSGPDRPRSPRAPLTTRYPRSMVRTVADVAARARLALVLTLLGVASLLAAASLDPTATAQTVVVMTALSAATALAGVHCLLAVPDAGIHSLRPRRRAADIPLVLAGRTTDVVHPVRPRAPGRV